MPRHPDDVVRVSYEWDVELLDEPFTTEDGEEDVDILDHCHSETAAEMVATFCRDRAAGQSGRMVLIRETSSEAEGMITRLWAYVDTDDMTLPEFFSDGLHDTGYRVPKKQRAEFDRCNVLAYCISKV
jgi:hypothetical protein